MLVEVVALTIVFATLYWILTHQAVYFHRVLFVISPANIITVYVLLLGGVLARGRLRFLRPFLVAVALYIAADSVLFNLQMYYPVSINTYYLLTLLISIAIIVSDLPKRHITSFLGFLLAALTSYLIVYPYSGFVAVILAAILAYFALTSLAFGFEGIVARGIAASRTYVVLALVAVAVIELAKPYLKGGLFDFAEWSFLALAAFLTFRKFKAEYDDSYLEPHSQLISERYDELAVALDRAADSFVNHGDKAMLIACISKTLLDAGYNEKELAKVILPVVNHHDRVPPVLSFPWEKSVVERRNVARRKKVLKMVLKNLGADAEKFGVDFEV